MHLNKNNIGKFWSIPKKGTKYSAVATHNRSESMPLVVVMRDVLKLVNTKKELKKLLNEKQIQINNKEIRETNYPVCLFDIISLSNLKKYYKSVLSEHKKMIFEEISAKEAEKKIFKVINKKMLSGGKLQLNLMQGINIISKEKINIGDSIIFNFKDKKIMKIIPMEKGKNVFVIKGRHTGKKGKIEEIIIRGGKKIAKITFNNEKINVWIKNIIIVE